MKKFIEFCEQHFTKKVLEDGTVCFYDDVYVEKLRHEINPFVMIYKGIDEIKIDKLEEDIAERVKRHTGGNIIFSKNYKNFLRTMNGVAIGHNSMSLYGFQTIDRSNFKLQSPYSLKDVNGIRSPCINGSLVGIGSYSYNNSDIYIDMVSGNIVCYNGDYHEMELTWTKKDREKYKAIEVPIIGKWKNIEELLLKETERLWNLFKQSPWEWQNMPENVLPTLDKTNNMT